MFHVKRFGTICGMMCTSWWTRTGGSAVRLKAACTVPLSLLAVRRAWPLAVGFSNVE
jgi:hypothetical protein